MRINYKKKRHRSSRIRIGTYVRLRAYVPTTMAGRDGRVIGCGKRAVLVDFGDVQYWILARFLERSVLDYVKEFIDP